MVVFKQANFGSGPPHIERNNLRQFQLPRQTLTAEIVSGDGVLQRVPLLCRIDTLDELEYYRNGGILHYVLRKLAA